MLIPIGDESKGIRFILVNWILIVINIFVFLYEINLTFAERETFYFQWGLVLPFFSEAIAHPFSLQSLQTFATLVTSQFVHLNFMHILGNVLFLYTFGQNVEQRMGNLGYLIFYLVCGVVAGITEAVVLLKVIGPAPIISFGASGAVAGMMGAYLIFTPLNRIYLRLFPLPLKIPVPAFILIVIWFVQQLAAGLDTLTPEAAWQAEVAFWAHIGGFVFGMLIALVFVIPANQRRAVVRTLFPIHEGPAALLENVAIGMLVLFLVGVLGPLLVDRVIAHPPAAPTPPPIVVFATITPTETISAPTPTSWPRVLVKLSGHSDYISSLAFSPDGKLLASASADHSIRLWNATTFEPVKILVGHTNVVNALAFSTDSSVLASGSLDKTVKLWNISSASLVNTTLQGHRDAVTGVAFSPDGKLLASASADRTVRIWNVTSGKLIKTLCTQPDGIMAVAYSPDGSMLATAGKDKTVRLYDGSGKQLTMLPGNTGIVYGLAWSYDNKRLASAGGDRIVRVWDVKTRKLLGISQRHTDIVSSVAFTPDDSYLVSTSRDNSVIVWNLSSGNPLISFTPSSRAMIGLAVNPLGTLMAAGGMDKIIYVWSAPWSNS